MPEAVIFQIGNHMSAQMIGFQIRNDPQHRGFSAKNVDFQIENERLQNSIYYLKIDHRKFGKVQIETELLQKKLSKQLMQMGYTRTHGRTEGRTITNFERTDLKPPRVARGTMEGNSLLLEW